MSSPKRVFLGLFLLFTVLLILLLVFLGYFFARPGMPVFQYAILFFLIILAVMAATSLSSLALAACFLLGGSPSPVLNRLVKKILIFLFPLIVQLGKLLHIDQEKVQGSFIMVNNQLVAIENQNISPQALLVLLPHCLQDEDCPHKITQDPYNCQRCGSCPIDKLLSVVENWQVNVQVATGGTLARKAVQIYHPECVLAVACERDLSSGIVDSYPLPVWGVLNERPMGPCRNTRVSLSTLEEKLKEILGKQRLKA